MSQLPDSTERRLSKLVDHKLYHNEAYYHAQVSQFRFWLTAAQMAMQDEEIDREVIECVLNRIVYGTPSGADAHERVRVNKQEMDFIMRGGAKPMEEVFKP